MTNRKRQRSRRAKRNPIRRAEEPVVAAARSVAERAASRNSPLELEALVDPSTGAPSAVVLLAVGPERVAALASVVPAIRQGKAIDANLLELSGVEVTGTRPSSSELAIAGLVGLVVGLGLALAVGDVVRGWWA